MAAIRKNTSIRLNGDNEHTDILKVTSMSDDGNWARVTLPNNATVWRHVSTLTVVPRVRKSRAKVTAVEAAAE